VNYLLIEGLEPSGLTALAH